MITCPSCKGKGTQKIEIVEIDVETNKNSTMDLKCVTCKGTGVISVEVYATYQFEVNMWCRCGNHSGDFDFFDDNEHYQISKHHYRCADCGKITQIG